MSIIHQIETLMTVALLLYGVAYWMAKNKNKYHKIIALIGFSMDAYGTVLMFQIKKGTMFSGVLASDIHTLLSLIAFALFFIQFTLGVLHKTQWHRKFAVRVFFPVWVLSFASGAFM